MSIFHKAIIKIYTGIDHIFVRVSVLRNVFNNSVFAHNVTDMIQIFKMLDMYYIK